MSVFEPVTFEWVGKSYEIPPKKIMGAIACVEKHVTLREIYLAIAERDAVPLAALCAGYGALLRYAGAKVEDEEVYDGLFTGPVPDQQQVWAALNGLMSLMIPPAHLQRDVAGARGPQKDTPQGNGEPTAARS